MFPLITNIAYYGFSFHGTVIAPQYRSITFLQFACPTNRIWSPFIKIIEVSGGSKRDKFYCSKIAGSILG